MADKKDKYGPGNTIDKWNGGSRENYEKWVFDKNRIAENKARKAPPATFPGGTRSEAEKWQRKLAESRSADTNDRMRDDLAARRKLQEDAGRMRVGKRLDKKDSMTALRRLAEAKASKKMSKTSKIGKMLDKKEMSDSPRRPSVTKTTKKPAFFETMKSSKKKSGK